ncbi:vanadium nitrogenase [Roseburia sp. 499]|nr:vanadium nitrogenase [Roseburia sp. 499]WVK71095.1 vanadium nitrogenase [Roseburia sp. 499]
MAVLNVFLEYGIKFVVLVAVAGLGIFLGKKLRDRSDAKKSIDEK